MPRTIAIWFLIFVVYSFAGWVLEVILSLVYRKKFINRGFLVGPICPIYGTGAIALALLLKPDESLVAIACVAMVGGAALEYSASFIMEKLFRVRWWDYSEKPININGRICMSSTILFGIAGVLMIKFITPGLMGFFASLNATFVLITAAVLALGLVGDVLLSLWLVLGVRVTVGTVQRDATAEISTRVKEILMDKGKLSRRLVKAFPNQTPSKKSVKPHVPKH